MTFNSGLFLFFLGFLIFLLLFIVGKKGGGESHIQCSLFGIIYYILGITSLYGVNWHYDLSSYFSHVIN